MDPIVPPSGGKVPGTQPAGSPAAGPAAGDAAKRAAAARDFEAVFLTQMVDQMMKTVKLGNMDGGHAQDIWRSFLAHAIAKEIADTGTTGIAQSVDGAMKAYAARGES